MVCHARSASLLACRRRKRTVLSPPLRPLAMLDLEKPTERQAHEFLCRATSKRSKSDQLWQLLDMRRQGGTLLCVVRWIHPEDAKKPFALAEVSLTERAVCWQCYETAEAARGGMDRRCAATPQEQGPQSAIPRR